MSLDEDLGTPAPTDTMEDYTKELSEYCPDEGEELLHEQDMGDALVLLNKCMTILSYLADPLLAPSITKRERQSAGRVADKIKEFLDEVQEHYV